MYDQLNYIQNIMTETEFDKAYDSGDLDQEYAEYIMDNCAGERAIGNSTSLLCAMEEGYLFESFKEGYLDI